MLQGGQLSGGEVVDASLDGGAKSKFRGHKKVHRADGTTYWRRTKSAMRRGIKHHKSVHRKKRSMGRK